MNAKISEFVLCVEAITYLLIHNLFDCTIPLLNNLFVSLNELKNISQKNIGVNLK